MHLYPDSFRRRAGEHRRCVYVIRGIVSRRATNVFTDDGDFPRVTAVRRTRLATTTELHESETIPLCLLLSWGLVPQLLPVGTLLQIHGASILAKVANSRERHTQKE